MNTRPPADRRQNISHQLSTPCFSFPASTLSSDCSTTTSNYKDNIHLTCKSLDTRLHGDMDSMRSLNRSLPSTPPRRNTGQPTEQLLQAFKSAALSVTNLYKTAASDQAQAHESGYQDALEDLLAFLNKDGLGLGDGEGATIRQWVTDRLQGSGHASSESDEEADEEKRGRSSSPILQRKLSRESVPPQHQQPQATQTAPRHESAPPTADNFTMPENTSATADALPRSDFSFRSAHAYPNDTDMDAAESALPANAAQNMPSMRLEVIPRTARTGPRLSTRATTRSSSLGNLGHGAGSKRRAPLGDFFDISSLGNGKDGFGGGGKRGRFI